MELKEALVAFASAVVARSSQEAIDAATDALAEALTPPAPAPVAQTPIKLPSLETFP